MNCCITEGPVVRRPRPLGWACTATAGLVLTLTSAASAVTIAVPGDAATIQDAIDLAANGDVVEIAAGTWSGPVDFLNKEITVRSASGVPADVIIDGGGVGTLVDMTTVGSGARLEGVTLQNPGAGPGDRLLLLTGSNAVIRFCVFEAASDGHSAPVRIDGVLIEVEGCRFDGLGATNAATIELDGDIDLAACLIRDCHAADGAVEVTDGLVRFGNCIIERSSATDPFAAGGVNVRQSATAQLAGCLVLGQEGGEFAPDSFDVTSSASLELLNCTVIDEIEDGSPAVASDGDVFVRNTIMNGLPAFDGPGTVDVAWSNIRGGWPGPGNISADPMFIDPASDNYGIDAGSPCIDAADGDAVAGLLAFDLVAGPRYVDDPNIPNVGVGTEPWLDMGALEHDLFIRYVDDDAGAGGDGLSWAAAYPDLQDALDDARDGGVREIWIAEGTYTPDRGTGDRDLSFELVDDVDVVGGFEGTERTRADRAGDGFPTNLSGAIGASGLADNTRHVVVGDGIGAETVLQGVIIRLGSADGGGGLPTPEAGAGLRLADSELRVEEVVVRGHDAVGPLGSAVAVANGAPVFRNCRFTSNGNTAPIAFALHTDGADVRLEGCLIDTNDCSVIAAGLHDGAFEVVNCTVVANASASGPSGLRLLDATGQVVRNSVFWGNTPAVPTGVPMIWQLFSNQLPTLVVERTTIQDYDPSLLLAAVASDGFDPMFADLDGPDDIPGNADDLPGPAANSPLIDRGDTTVLASGFDVDVLGQARVVDDPGTSDDGVGSPVVDRGAIEFAGIGCPADVNGDGAVDFTDLLGVLAAWGACTDCAADIDRDQDVDFEDLLAVLAAWGPCPS